jgi:tRNA pseudouridine55 synthase
MISGVLVVDKPQGPTSHDIVAVARRALRERRIGHCGTLDPMATGVLALAVGQATRLVQFLSSEAKHYNAVVRFGRTTNSYDVTGETVAESPERPTRDALAAALAQFRGTFAQMPPAFSAKKIGGIRAYRLARRNAAATLDLRQVQVTVSQLDLVAFDDDRATLAMRVSAGFYVRSLAHDLGQALGMGATLEALRRTRAGSFAVEDAITVDALAAGDATALTHGVIPLARLLPEVPALTLSSDDAVRARRGMDLPIPNTWTAAPPLARLLDEHGGLLALATPSAQPGLLHPSVVLG